MIYDFIFWLFGEENKDEEKRGKRKRGEREKILEGLWRGYVGRIFCVEE